MSEVFFVSSQNPNDGIGGGGCLCNPLKDRDCVGPFAIFHATETDSNMSPHAVLSLACARKFVKAAKTGEALVCGETGAPALIKGQMTIIDSTAEEIV